jgi:hypothetical protein
MPLATFFTTLNNAPETVGFADTMATIDALCEFTPTTFRNGEITNNAGENNGSCKLFAFAQLNDLSEEQTLACFGAYYRDDVLGNAEGDDHQNIRNFMITGWAGIEFDGMPLALKPRS